MMIIIDIFLWIWSHFPVLAISSDRNFGTLSLKHLKLEEKHLRISLINFMFGDCIVYLFTYDIQEKRFEVKYILRLNKIFDTDDTIDKREAGYKDHILELKSNADRETEKESLCYRIQNEEQRISTSIDKINIYATVILTVIPLLLAILDLKKVILLPLSIKIGIAFICYSLFNICAYIFRGIQVNGISKSSFADLRRSQNKNQDIIIQYYYDWQQVKRKADVFVSFVLNLQEWILSILFLIIFVSLGIFFDGDLVEDNRYLSKGDIVTTVYIEDIDEPYTSSAVSWADLILDIETLQCSEVILISNNTDNILFLAERLDKYDELVIKLLNDNTMRTGEMKIIEEK